MTPTEGETMAAMNAAAKRLYDEGRTEQMAAEQILIPTWEQVDQSVRNQALDEVNSVVWAALQALPDRLSPIRQLMHEVNPEIHEDMTAFLGEVKVLLSGSKG